MTGTGTKHEHDSTKALKKDLEQAIERERTLEERVDALETSVKLQTQAAKQMEDFKQAVAGLHEHSNFKDFQLAVQNAFQKLVVLCDWPTPNAEVTEDEQSSPENIEAGQ